MRAQADSSAAQERSNAETGSFDVIMNSHGTSTVFNSCVLRSEGGMGGEGLSKFKDRQTRSEIDSH